MNAGEGNPWDAPEAGQPPAAPEPAPIAAAPAAEPTPPAPPAEPAPTGPPPDDVDPNRNKIVLIALGAFVVIALVGFLLSRHGSSDPSSSTNTTTPATVAGGGSTPAGGSGGGGGATTGGQSVSITGTVDGFARSDSKTSMGALPNGTKWTVQTGTWGITNGTAYVADADATHRNVVFIPTGYASGQAQVKITTMQPQSGLVFRYEGPCAYWAIESSPAVATWNIVKVAKCKATQMGNTGYTAVGDGVTVGVVFTDTTITVVVNGKAVKTLDNSDLAGSGKVGLVVSGTAATKVRFDDFTAGGPKGQGVVKAETKPGAGGNKSTTTTAPK